MAASIGHQQAGLLALLLPCKHLASVFVWAVLSKRQRLLLWHAKDRGPLAVRHDVCLILLEAAFGSLLHEVFHLGYGERVWQAFRRGKEFDGQSG